MPNESPVRQLEVNLAEFSATAAIGG